MTTNEQQRSAEKAAFGKSPSTAGLERLSWYEHGKGWALAESFENPCGNWTSGDIARAFEAGALAAEKLEREACANVCSMASVTMATRDMTRGALFCMGEIRKRSNVSVSSGALADDETEGGRSPSA